MLMSKEKFAELQFNALRKEIETAKATMLKFIVGGSAIIPTAQYLADTFAIGAVTLALPIIVVVLVLLFLSENHAMMRAGTYILQEIEPNIEGIVGWETWLNSDGGKRGSRTVDKLVVVSFAIVAASYFIGSILLAGRYAAEVFGNQGQFLLTLGYVIIGFSLAGVLYWQARTDTE